MARKFAFAAFLATSEAARLSAQAASTQNSTGRGIVDNLYTFGAPKVSAPEMENLARSDKCFPGYRVVNFRRELIWDVDVVPSLMVSLQYVHPSIATLMQDQKGGYKLRSCGENPISFSTPSVLLHNKDTYISRAERYSDSDLKITAQVGLRLSYESNLNTVRSTAQSYGWRLVGSAKVGEDVSHVFQNPSTLACQISFEGSDSFGDFITDAAIVRVNFCGRKGVHLGFANEINRIAASGAWQSNVKSKLSGCSSVAATGHSLGGAVATLFAGCVNSAKAGNSEYEQLAWTRGTAVEHPEF